MQKNLESALVYAGMDWPVIPCGMMSKRPLTEHGFKDGTTDEAIIQEWWKEWPDANVAVSIPEWMAVVDIDAPEAFDSIPYLPETVTSITPRSGSGHHHFYRLPEGLVIPRKIRPLYGIDILAHGGLVVLPYSVHPNGGVYKWLRAPTKNQIKMLPEWIIKVIQSSEENYESQKINPEIILAGVEEGHRQEALFKYACSMRARKFSWGEALAQLETAARNAIPPFSEQSADYILGRVWARFPEGGVREFDLATVERKRARNVWRASDLLGSSLEEPEWVVEKILPQGFCLFSGDPKTGKSIQALNLAVDVVSNGRVWNRYHVLESPVLYLDLEMSPTTGKARLNQVLSGRELNLDNLHIAYSWDPMDVGGLEALSQFIDFHQVRLVVIDPLGVVWNTKESGGTAYHKDRAMIDPLAQLARDYKISIIGVHHKPKTQYDSLMRQTSGSMGLTAASDTVWGFDRKDGEDVAYLNVGGKMVKEERDIELLPLFGNKFRWVARELEEPA
jgi:hypothetical protein